MAGGESPLSTLLYSWAPVLLMIGFWIYFMRKMPGIGKQAGYLDRQQQHMAKSEELLARIAVALEERNRLRRDS
jgi:hypothetical protein